MARQTIAQLQEQVAKLGTEIVRLNDQLAEARVRDGERTFAFRLMESICQDQKEP